MFKIILQNLRLTFGVMKQDFFIYRLFSFFSRSSHGEYKITMQPCVYCDCILYKYVKDNFSPITNYLLSFQFESVPVRSCYIDMNQISKRNRMTKSLYVTRTGKLSTFY